MTEARTRVRSRLDSGALRSLMALIATASLCGLPGWLALSGSPMGLGAARASSAEEVVRRDYAIAGFKAPPRWELRPRDRSSYPQLLAWAERIQSGERAVMTLVGQRVSAGTTLQRFAEQTTELRSQGRVSNLRVLTQRASLWPVGQRIQVDAQLVAPEGRRPQLLRQYLFLNPPFGYVLTVVTPAEQAAARFRDLEDTAADLVPLPPEPEKVEKPAP